MAYVQSARECEGRIGSKSDGEAGAAVVCVPQPRQMTTPKKEKNGGEKESLYRDAL